jgi:two-component system chemotaxis response regulator CheY
VRPTILTIDDSKGLRLMVEKTLSAFDCEVNEASNGFNGFFAIERARPDLILLDVAMPVMNGVDMLERLKATPELADIPVLMLTSPTDHAVMGDIATLGASETLMKPFTPAALLGKIRAIIKLKPRPAPKPTTPPQP